MIISIELNRIELDWIVYLFNVYFSFQCSVYDVSKERIMMMKIIYISHMAPARVFGTQMVSGQMMFKQRSSAQISKQFFL